MTIYFATIRLTHGVHAGPLGFTGELYKYVEAESPEAACALAESWADAYGLTATRVEATPAVKQARNSYAFPEHIISAI